MTTHWARAWLARACELRLRQVDFAPDTLYALREDLELRVANVDVEGLTLVIEEKTTPATINSFGPDWDDPNALPRIHVQVRLLWETVEHPASIVGVVARQEGAEVCRRIWPTFFA